MKKDNICKDQNQVEKAIKIFNTTLHNYSCNYPCEYLSDLNNHQVEAIPGSHFFMFKRFVEKRTAKHLYSLIDLFAALGGYLGSFLGVSLFHLREGFAFLIKKAINSNVP